MSESGPLSLDEDSKHKTAVRQIIRYRQTKQANISSKEEGTAYVQRTE